jgi:transcriptional regulator with XRE-family HTH domain
MTLGQQMTALRKKKGLSQADLGKAVGTSGILSDDMNAMK